MTMLSLLALAAGQRGGLVVPQRPVLRRPLSQVTLTPFLTTSGYYRIHDPAFYAGLSRFRLPRGGSFLRPDERNLKIKLPAQSLLPSGEGIEPLKPMEGNGEFKLYHLYLPGETDYSAIFGIFAKKETPFDADFGTVAFDSGPHYGTYTGVAAKTGTLVLSPCTGDSRIRPAEVKTFTGEIGADGKPKVDAQKNVYGAKGEITIPIKAGQEYQARYAIATDGAEEGTHTATGTIDGGSVVRMNLHAVVNRPKTDYALTFTPNELNAQAGNTIKIKGDVSVVKSDMTSPGAYFTIANAVEMQNKQIFIQPPQPQTLTTVKKRNWDMSVYFHPEDPDMDGYIILNLSAGIADNLPIDQYLIPYHVRSTWVDSGPIHIVNGGATIDGSFRFNSTGAFVFSGTASSTNPNDQAYAYVMIDKAIGGKKYGAYSAFWLPKGGTKGTFLNFGRSQAIRDHFAELKGVKMKAYLSTNNFAAVKDSMESDDFAWLKDDIKG